MPNDTITKPEPAGEMSSGESRDPGSRPAGPRRAFRRAIMITTIAVSVAAIGAGGYFFRDRIEFRRAPEETLKDEIAELVSEVGKLIVLPEGEMPTIATVTDPERLKDQAFFSKAKAGDKVLIYTNAKKAILYDPVQHKIIEVAPLNIGNQ